MLPLVLYSSASDSSGEDDDLMRFKMGIKRKHANLIPVIRHSKKKKLPAVPISLFSSDSDDDVKTNELPSFTSRIRNFPHVDGDWPSQIYITVIDGSTRFNNAAALAVTTLENTMLHSDGESIDSLPRVENLIQSKDKDNGLHLSLSKSFSLRRFQINPFFSCLEKCIASFPRFEITLEGGDVFINDEHTRSFIGLLVTEGLDKVLDIIKKVDTTMQSFRKQTYYENPIPHISVASVSYDITASKCNTMTGNIRSTTINTTAGTAPCNANKEIDISIIKKRMKDIYISKLMVQSIVFKCGSKVFEINLS